MLDSTCYFSFLVCWRRGEGKVRYFLFKTRSVCHLHPCTLTHTGRKYDIHIAFCNLGKLWMEECIITGIALSTSAFTAVPFCLAGHLPHPSSLKFSAPYCSTTKHYPFVFMLACSQLHPVTVPACSEFLHPELPMS